MSTPKKIYIPQIDSTIEIPEGMDEDAARGEAIKSFQETFPNEYESKQKSIEEFKKQFLDPLEWGDEDQPSNSAPTKIPNTNKVNLPAKGAANFNIAKLAFGLPEVLGGYAGNKIADLIGLPKNEEVLENQRKDSDALYKGLESGLSANLTNPLKAGGASVIDEIYQLIGKSPERSLGESYDLYRQSQKEDQAKTLKESPISNILGQITGAVMPVGVGSQLFTRGGKLVSTLTGGKKVADKIPVIKKLLDAALTGGATNLAYQAIDPEVDIKNPLKTALTGAAFNFVPTAVGETLKKSWNSGLIQDKTIPALKAGFKESALTNWIPAMFDALKNGKFKNTMGQLNNKMGLQDKQAVVKELLDTVNDAKGGIESNFGNLKFENQLNKLKNSLGDKESLVKQLIDMSDNVKKGITVPHGKLKQNLFNKLGKEKVIPSKITDEIKSIFDKEGLVWGKNKLNLNPLKKYAINNNRIPGFQKLEDLYKKLKDQKIPLNEINQILKSLRGDAKFKSIDRGEYEKLMGALYNRTTGTIDDAIGDLAGGRTKEVFQNLRKNVSEMKADFGKKNVGLDRLLKKEPEQIIKDFGNKNIATYVKDLVEKYPKLKTPASNVLLKNLTDNSKSRENIANFISQYGAENLKKVLPKDKFDEIMSLASETKYDTIMSGFKDLDKTLGKDSSLIVDSIRTNFRPDYTKKIISDYPQLKGPVEKVVLSHFFNKATDPQSLAGLMKNYGVNELRQILSKENFNLLQKVTGNKALFDQVKKSGLWGKVSPGLKAYGAKELDTR